MKIAFVSTYDPNNKILRSGVPYSIYHQLAKDNEMIWIEPKIEGFLDKFLFEIVHLFTWVMARLGKKMMHIPLRARLYCNSVQRQLAKVEYDCIFTIGSMEIAYIKTEKPIYCRADAIIDSFVDYYTFNVPKFAQRWAHNVEERALQNMTKFFVPSQWVIDEIHRVGMRIPEDKLVLAETGANLDPADIKLKKHEYGLDKELNMIMVGYDVMRKGLNVAYDAARILNEKYHVKAYVTVMGGRPTNEMLQSGYVRYVGMKNKNIKKEYDEFYDIFSSADLFIFPTKAECHGIVNCEAAAYGLPIFANNTGGVSNYCVDGVNGRCLPVTSGGEEYADAIFNALKNNEMAKFSEGSSELYNKRFNWSVWGAIVSNVINLQHV